jgi:hypothetical protein
MPQFAIPLLLTLILLCSALIWRLHRNNRRLTRRVHTLETENSQLKTELSAALEKLTDLEAVTLTADGLLERVVSGLVGLGVPGLVLLVAIGVSGFAGAAAITTALSTLGGPAGMVGGIGVLVLLGLASRAVTRHGLPRIAGLVVRGLVKKGYTSDSIRAQISKYPTWIVSSELRKTIDAVLGQTQASQQGASVGG